MVLLTTPRVMVLFGLRTFKLRFSVCHSSDTSLAADGVKYAFQARRLLALHCTYESFYIRIIVFVIVIIIFYLAVLLF